MIKQVGGTHYRNDEGEMHAKRVVRLNLPWPIANGTKYPERCLDRGSMRLDLEKAISYLQMALEMLDEGLIAPRNPADPDFKGEKPPEIAGEVVEDIPAVSGRGVIRKRVSRR